MAGNVIDALFVTLGLDVSQFNKGKKEAIDGLKDVDKQEEQLSQKSKKRKKEESEEGRRNSEEEDKNSKRRKRNNKEEVDSFEKVTNSILAVGAAMVTVSAAKQFITSQVQTNMELGKTSKFLGENAKGLDAWGFAAEAVGGNAKFFLNSIVNIRSELAKFRIGKGGAETATTLAQLGITSAESKKAKDFLFDVHDALVKVRNEKGELTAKSFAQSLGFDEDGYILLTKTRYELEKLLDTGEKQSGVNEKTTESAKKLTEAWKTFKGAIEGVSGDLFEQLAPGLERTTNLATKAVNAFREWNKESSDRIKEAQKTDPVSIWWRKLTGQGEFDPKRREGGGLIKQGGSTGNDAQSIVDFFKSKGWTEDQAKGITANIIRESRGNASAVGDNGSAYGLGQWHPDRQAQFKQLFNKDIQGSSVQEQLTFFDWELKNSHRNAGDLLRGTNNAGDAARAVSLYHERPAGSFLEANYRANLANNLPLTTDQSNNSTSSNVQTHIDTINVTTQVQDALGFSRELKEALSKNQVMNAGVGGAV